MTSAASLSRSPEARACFALRAYRKKVGFEALVDTPKRLARSLRDVGSLVLRRVALVKKRDSVARFLAGIGEPTCVSDRSPPRGPPY